MEVATLVREVDPLEFLTVPEEEASRVLVVVVVPDSLLAEASRVVRFEERTVSLVDSRVVLLPLTISPLSLALPRVDTERSRDVTPSLEEERTPD